MMLRLVLLAPFALVQTPTDSASLAIADGVAAEARGDGRGMLAAARSLEAVGAKPRAGETDLAAYWRKQASARGVRDKMPPVRGGRLDPAIAEACWLPGRCCPPNRSFWRGKKPR